MRKKVGDALLQLGITPDLKGFNYIIDMVEMIDKGEVDKITEAYKTIGKRRNETGTSVERCIRHAISKINTTSKEFDTYIGESVISFEKGNIVNSAFLNTLHYRLKEQWSEIETTVDDNKTKIQQTFDMVSAHEFSVDWNGWNFFIIYGKYNGGWFIAIPNWKICVEATEPTNIYYNIDKLSQAFNDHDKGKNVAEAIREHWESINKED